MSQTCKSKPFLQLGLEKLINLVGFRHDVDEPRILEHYQFKMFDSSETRPIQRKGFNPANSYNVW